MVRGIFTSLVVCSILVGCAGEKQPSGPEVSQSIPQVDQTEHAQPRRPRTSLKTVEGKMSFSIMNSAVVLETLFKQKGIVRGVSLPLEVALAANDGGATMCGFDWAGSEKALLQVGESGSLQAVAEKIGEKSSLVKAAVLFKENRWLGITCLRKGKDVPTLEDMANTLIGLIRIQRN